MKVLHIITSLHPDGAQQMLKRVVMGQMSGVTHAVVSLAAPVGLSEYFRDAGVELHHLHLRKLCNPFSAARAFAEVVALSKPDLIHSWLYHANLISGLTTRMLGSSAPPLIWGLRGSLVKIRPSTLPLWGVIYWTKCISRTPQRIVANSPVSLEQHVTLGYPKDRLSFLPNGFDSERIFRNEAVRSELRSKLGIGPTDAAILVCGRDDPTKGFPVFLCAFAKVVESVPSAIAIMVGRDVDTSVELTKLISEMGLHDKVRRVGYTVNPEHYMSAADIGCSSSLSEGFPNVVAESMLCELPMVVTDVGMSKDIVGEYGKVVVPGEPIALAEALIEGIRAGSATQRQLGKLSRQRIVDRYGIATILSETRIMYERLLAANHKGSNGGS